MIQLQLNQQTYYFSVIHITKQSPDKLIYGILINAENYYLSKSLGIDDCCQLDTQPPLAVGFISEICEILTRFEVLYCDYPGLEQVNLDIIKALALNRSSALPALKTAG
jgi:hypothetical protein